MHLCRSTFPPAVAERHEELGAALCEAGAAGKAHAAAAAEWRAAALKLRHARDQRDKLAAADPPRPKKVKALDKELEKVREGHARVSEHLEGSFVHTAVVCAAPRETQRGPRPGAAGPRRLRARPRGGERDAAAVLPRRRGRHHARESAARREGGGGEGSELTRRCRIPQCAEVGFEAVVGRATRTAAAAEGARATAARDGAGALLAAAEALDALADRQRVVAAHAAAFAPPRPLPWRGAPPDALDADVRDLLAGAADDDDAAAQAVRAELAARLVQLDAAARRLRVECREAAKTLDAAEAELVRQVGALRSDRPTKPTVADRCRCADGGRRDRRERAVRPRRRGRAAAAAGRGRGAAPRPGGLLPCGQ